MPGKSIPKIRWLELLSFDKFVHASIFFIEEVLLLRALIHLAQKNTFVHKNYKWASALFCILYGGSLEIMQYTLFSERSGDVLDFIANSTGVVLALFLYKPLAKKIKGLA
jgi:glycopeptide antibiotics resistance protein